VSSSFDDPGEAERHFASRADAARCGRSLAAIACAVLGAFTCACKDGRSAPAPPREPSIVRGDRVVVEATAAEFFEARVLQATKESLRVAPAEGEPISVAPGDVYRLPQAAGRFDVGAFAICNLEDAWVGCRIESRAPTGFVVSTTTGKRAELSSRALLQPSAVTELNLRNRFARAAARAAFLEAVARAGAPAAPPGYRPVPRARVVAKREGGWYTAVVEAVDRDGASVTFSADAWNTRVGLADLVPEPTSANPAPARGDFVLLRPSSPAEPWAPARVLGMVDDAIKVTNVEGTERLVSVRDVLTLAPG